ncbi:hypothetical protein QMZ30_19190 [Pantoea sp. EA-12]|nr:hypothetical protein [Pantoea sp. EA-12]MDI9223041.1 hypothetical protein [Pantoea sp. EA-12]
MTFKKSANIYLVEKQQNYQMHRRMMTVHCTAMQQQRTNMSQAALA